MKKQSNNKQASTKDIIVTSKKEVISKIDLAKDAIIEAVYDATKKGKRNKSKSSQGRGTRSTKMMVIQRCALFYYVTIDLHKSIKELTHADAHHVWNDPEHSKVWIKASQRTDERRGYKDYNSLYSAMRTRIDKGKLKTTEFCAD